jgi:hypothetical protein
MLWWLRYILWEEYHRYCHTAYNSYTGHLVCLTDNSRFLYDDQPAARTT